MGKRVLAFVSAFIVTYALAVATASQAVLAYLASLGREIGFAERLAAIGHDVVGMLGGFAPIVLVTLLIAYGIVAFIVSKRAGLRLVGYTVGGFAGMVCVHLLLQAVFGMIPVWGAGGAFGLLLQGLAGAVGGSLYTRINPVRA